MSRGRRCWLWQMVISVVAGLSPLVAHGVDARGSSWEIDGNKGTVCGAGGAAEQRHGGAASSLLLWNPTLVATSPLAILVRCKSCRWFQPKPPASPLLSESPSPPLLHLRVPRHAEPSPPSLQSTANPSKPQLGPEPSIHQQLTDPAITINRHRTKHRKPVPSSAPQSPAPLWSTTCAPAPRA
ncbi:hypothetical protein M0R45_002058 [Rubus argutus]|uniref:Uncharacterized protein n=1 Tax=Rubus argutus TaxID=59490 RepID=A0AAW1VDH6_RUBAR